MKSRLLAQYHCNFGSTETFFYPYVCLVLFDKSNYWPFLILCHLYCGYSLLKGHKIVKFVIQLYNHVCERNIYSIVVFRLM